VRANLRAGRRLWSILNQVTAEMARDDPVQERLYAAIKSSRAHVIAA